MRQAGIQGVLRTKRSARRAGIRTLAGIRISSAVSFGLMGPTSYG
jgi:hypothetical protein